uniref:Methyltransferase domain-containing protein n=1 Tax=Kwoniella pini CBS 10737 TaxID=1296096 RepID=A0A1B9I2X9_9TREE|nr:uncharacterized protein I206_04317 [Kwoniella pini CBS 10737]OCF49791.1 hypothetical protein I206_04317 [Kwoniella pini CBS 10737]
MDHQNTSSHSRSASYSPAEGHDDGHDRDYFLNDEGVESRHSGQNLDVSQAPYSVESERAYNNVSWVYRFPADQDEVLDRQHYVMLISLPGLYRGPVEEILNDSSRPRRLLDIGCGTGIWVQEMAEQFPRVDCIGVDITPLQHDTHLRNCTYMQVNAPDGLRVFGNESFDVVNMRQMIHATDDYPALIRAAYRLLRPGGVLLLHEIQLRFHSAWEGFTVHDSAPGAAQIIEWLDAAHRYRGIDTSLWSRMEDILIEAGFREDATEVYYHTRQICPAELDTEHGANETLNSAGYMYATRLMILECGVTDEDGFDETFAMATEEVRGNSPGRAGPLGAQGVLSPWAYWWAVKR